MKFTRPMQLRICPGCGGEKYVSKYAIEHGQNLICRSCASKRVAAKIRAGKSTVCSIEDCNHKYKGRGLCDMHLWRLRNNGSLSTIRVIDKTRSGHELSNTYLSMNQRCSNPNAPNYKYYGGRGIRVCKRWLGFNGFQNFCSDMGNRPNGMTLDRIDNDGNYEPGNCRWATWQQQRANQRTKEEMKETTHEPKCKRIR